MLKQLENIQIPVPGELDLDLDNIAAISDAVKRNFTALHISVSAGGGEDLGGVSASSAVLPSGTDPEYEQFLADVWVGVVLTLMVLSCVCCMCSCLLYHKFQQWKRSVIESREAADIESARQDAESLPSYTIASGLPSYEEALEQLRTVKAHLSAYANGTGGTITTATHDDHHLHPHHLHHRKSVDVVAWLPTTPPTPRIGGGVTSLTVTNLFQIYRRNSLNNSMNGESTKPDS